MNDYTIVYLAIPLLMDTEVAPAFHYYKQSLIYMHVC